MTKQRIDLLLVARGLFESRAQAQAAIAAGLVAADGASVRKASEMVGVEAAISAHAPHPYVSRGGVKLASALDHFGISAASRVCLDVGASTGGFTQVLLARGARLVHAIDVGREQLHGSLRDDPRVISREATDIRALAAGALAPPPDLVVIDASFISLRHVIAPALALAARPADLVALIKPQFEAGRRDVKKGVVRDAAVHAAVCEAMTAFVASLDAEVIGLAPSPITGGDGNAEFFIAAQVR